MFIGVSSILIVCSLARASSGFQLPEQYIGSPLRKGTIGKGSLDHNLIRGLTLSSYSSPGLVMYQLKELMRMNQWRIIYDYRTAESFQELDNEESRCSFGLVYEFLTKYQAYKTTNKTEAHPEVMLNFLEYYGRKKFPACAREAMFDIEDEFDQLDEYHERPIRFFKLALSLDGRASDSKFYDELKRFKPLESEINVDNLAPICRRTRPHETAAGRIKRKFDSMCKIVKNFSKMAMNTLNLANYFDPKEKYFEKNPRIGAMNEMRRACLEVEENDTLLEHLKKLCKPEHDSIGPWKFSTL